jgi:hypothetical protein
MTKYKAPPTAIYQPTDQEPTYVHGKKSSRQRATLITLVGGGGGGSTDDAKWSYSLHHYTF